METVIVDWGLVFEVIYYPHVVWIMNIIRFRLIEKRATNRYLKLPMVEDISNFTWLT